MTMTKEPEAVPGPQWQGWPACPLSFGLSLGEPPAVVRAPPTPATGAQQGYVGAQAGAFAGASEAKPAALHGGRNVGTGRPERLGALADAMPGWS